MSFPTASYVLNDGEYDKRPSVGNLGDIEAIKSMWLGSPIEQVSTNE